MDPENVVDMWQWREKKTRAEAKEAQMHMQPNGCRYKKKKRDICEYSGAVQTRAHGDSHVPKIDQPHPVHIPRYSNKSGKSFVRSKGLFLLCPNSQK